MLAAARQPQEASERADREATVVALGIGHWSGKEITDKDSAVLAGKRYGRALRYVAEEFRQDRAAAFAESDEPRSAPLPAARPPLEDRAAADRTSSGFKASSYKPPQTPTLDEDLPQPGHRAGSPRQAGADDEPDATWYGTGINL